MSASTGVITVYYDETLLWEETGSLLSNFKASDFQMTYVYLLSVMDLRVHYPRPSKGISPVNWFQSLHPHCYLSKQVTAHLDHYSILPSGLPVPSLFLLYPLSHR